MPKIIKKEGVVAKVVELFLDAPHTYVHRNGWLSHNCKHCKKAYLMEDEVTPRVFRLSDLKANGSNYGLKTADWVPTLGSLHPNCRCSLSEIPQGFGFKENSSTLTYKGPDFKYKNPE